MPALERPLPVPWPAAGLALTGPGAHAAARGFLTAALATGGPDQPDARTQIVMPSPTAVTLLGTAPAQLPATPRLLVTADLDEALELLEAQALHRTRLLYQREVDTVASLRATDPYEEPLPPILLLAEATVQRVRVAALLAQGHRLDIHGVLLGPWPDGGTVAVADSGATTADDSDRHPDEPPADVGRLTVLTAGETLDLMSTLAEAHTGHPQTHGSHEVTPRQASTRADAARSPDGTGGLPADATDDLGTANATDTADADSPDPTPNGPATATSSMTAAGPVDEQTAVKDDAAAGNVTTGHARTDEPDIADSSAGAEPAGYGWPCSERRPSSTPTRSAASGPSRWNCWSI
ncbi:hypothetical protein ACVCAH_35670 [Micromonospora sp. LZ34]